MTEKIDARLAPDLGKGALPDFPALRTPWEKLISFYDAYHYACRHNASVAACFMQVLRILMPDYNTRAKALCDINHDILLHYFSMPQTQKMFADRHNVHPFIKGAMTTALFGDEGDEQLLMSGRVNDYGPHRFEKELDTCPWDIVGSEYCRCTTYFFQAVGEAYGEPTMEYNMVEAKGTGDLHCRIVAENRDKYPLPKKECYESFGPIATADKIKYTPEENCYKDPQQLRPECNGKYRNGLCAEWTAAEMYQTSAGHALGSDNVLNVLNVLEPDKAKTEHVTRCVFEAAGKMAFAEFYAIKGLRDWLGVPGEVNDGRILGGLIEVILQAILAKYTVQAFNGNEVILDIEAGGLERHYPLLTTAYLSMWNGMCKTLVGAMWALWQETEGVPENIVRIKIARKIDKHC